MTTPVGIAQPSYNKPPITEAVIAMHFSKPLELKWIEAFARKHNTRFSRSEDMFEISASFNAQTHQSASNTKKIGYKLTSGDNARVVTIVPSQLAISHLAPYTDWGELCSDARQHWTTLSKIMKSKSLGHISARYINRIDIPIKTDGGVDIHKYFNLGLSLPTYVQTMALQAFQVNCSLHNANEPYLYTLSIASTPSPLINYLSFIIDIDVATTGVVPVDEDKLWELIDSLRKQKNDLFESCITSETRALFQ